MFNLFIYNNLLTMIVLQSVLFTLIIVLIKMLKKKNEYQNSQKKKITGLFFWNIAGLPLNWNFIIKLNILNTENKESSVILLIILFLNTILLLVYLYKTQIIQIDIKKKYDKFKSTQQLVMCILLLNFTYPILPLLII